jgi:tRNA A-37 threonylcarbamoyl transferase component Bud32
MVDQSNIPWQLFLLLFLCRSRADKIKTRRRNEFQDFITILDFQSQALLDNTVTELILEESTKATAAIKVHDDPENTNRVMEFKNLQVSLREDPLRVIYPPTCQFPTFRTIRLAELVQEYEIADGVFRVLHKGNDKSYVLKMVNRPSYQPLDSDVIRQELENLEQFKSIAGIVQPAGAAVLPNPYMTDPQSSDPQIVISGILLEYYSGGTLQHVLKERRVREFCWEQWAVQIGNALDTIHWEKKTLMDLKPSNVVLDEQGNAVLIDISGIGGVTYEWRAPEIQDEISPFDLPFQARRWNDVWAYGAIIKQLASQVEDCPFGRTLKMVADHLTKDIHTKWTLSEAISQLEASVS